MTHPGGRRALLAALAATAAVPAAAQEVWPTRPVRLVVPYAPGGPTDLIARVLAEALLPTLGQPLVIENRAGAGGVVGAEAVARAAPDGHTLLLAASAFVMGATLFPRLPYDPQRDFTPVTQVAHYALVLATHPSLPVRSVAELVEHARARPGEVTAASAGIGNANHMAAALFEAAAGVRLTHVQYPGAAPAHAALLAGQVALMFQNPTLATPSVRDGRLRGLATTGAARWRELPELPTLAESGYPGFEAGTWYGLLGPAGLPAPVVARLHAAVQDALRRPEVAARLNNGGLDLLDAGPDAFRTTIAADLAKWAALVRSAGITAE